MARTTVRQSVILAVILLVFVGVSFVRGADEYAEAEVIGQNVADFKELSDRFETLAEDKGAEYAFEVLRRAKLPGNTDLHLLGHVVGDMLYAQQGVDGIALCTQEFRNACSHSIATGALNEYGGAPALERIREACKKAPGGAGAYTMCYHGLGHGIFAFFGYDIAPTIDMCALTGTDAYHQQEYYECAGGAVMELMGGGGHDPELWRESRAKYLDPNDPLSPCTDDVIPDDVKQLCLIYLTPRLWELAGIDLGRPDPTLFADAFAFCAALPLSQQEFRDACFGGFGKEFVPLAGGRDIRAVDQLPDSAYAHAIEWCSFAPAEDGRRACIADAVASLFWGGENDPDASFRFCALAEDFEMRGACYARLAHDIGTYVLDDRRDALCARLSDEHRAACAGTP